MIRCCFVDFDDVRALFSLFNFISDLIVMPVDRSQQFNSLSLSLSVRGYFIELSATADTQMYDISFTDTFAYIVVFAF